MANERDDKLEGQDDGEYHFSDDQINYEMEEVPVTEEAKPVHAESALSKAGNYRRYIIGGGVFIVLIYMVYRMLVPATTPPPTEIAQTATPAKPAMSLPAMSAAPQARPVATPPSPSQPPQVQPAAQAGPSQPPQAVMQMPTESMPPQTAPSAPPIMVQAQQQAAPMSAPTDSKTIIDKLSILEEQNAKLTNALDTNSQKISSYETQNTALQAKVLELTTRIANIESGLSQLSQMQGDKTVQVATTSTTTSAAPRRRSPGVPSSIKSSEARVNYTVQAIIPGRAWLKSDMGDTVTVAEGDVLKSFGRVIKLDPYDGVVEVDTGSRVITLTYGGGSS